MNVHVLKPQTATFDDFWKVYPRKIKRALALAKWNAITSEEGLKTKTLDKDSGTYVEIHLKATPEEILEGARRYREAQREPGTGNYGFKDGGKFIAHPANWLNQGRWEDF